MVSQHLLIPRPSLLDHSFYRRWVVGELTLDELRDYAGQYAHVVAGLPRWLRQATAGAPAQAEALERHAAEEDRHLELWTRFATAVGMTREELAATPANPATTELIEAMVSFHPIIATFRSPATCAAVYGTLTTDWLVCGVAKLLCT